MPSGLAWYHHRAFQACLQLTLQAQTSNFHGPRSSQYPQPLPPAPAPYCKAGCLPMCFLNHRLHPHHPLPSRLPQHLLCAQAVSEASSTGTRTQCLTVAAQCPPGTGRNAGATNSLQGKMVWQIYRNWKRVCPVPQGIHSRQAFLVWNEGSCPIIC